MTEPAPVSFDAVLYENSTLGVNLVSQVNGETVVDYFDFNSAGPDVTEAYNYDRAEHFADVWIQWYEDTDGDPSALELVQDTLMHAVFNDQNFVDQYIKVGSDPGGFLRRPMQVTAGADDFAQAVEDARAVIWFMHETMGAVEVPAPAAELQPDFLLI